MNDFDKWEKEEAVKRAASFNQKKINEKVKIEKAKHEAGIGVEDGSEEFEEEDEE